MLSPKLVISFLTIIFVVGTFSQNLNYENCRYQKIDNSYPPVYITFEELSKENNLKNSKNTIWLRLHNNTNCELVIPTGFSGYYRIKNGKVVNVVDDGEKIDIYYFVEKILTKKQKNSLIWPKEIIYSRKPHSYDDFFQNIRIASGNSILFNVPVEYFKKRYRIVVPYNYSWEGLFGLGDGSHEVIYFWDDVPQGLRNITVER
jgi:hypothetical protein